MLAGMKFFIPGLTDTEVPRILQAVADAGAKRAQADTQRQGDRFARMDDRRVFHRHGG